MPSFRTLRLGLRRLLHRADADRDLDDEVQSFLDESAASKVRAGMTPDTAARQARVELGSVSAVKEQVRSGGWEATLEGWWQDLRYGVRGLRRNAGFTIVAVLTLSLGIGANSAMFSVVNGVILRPLPYAAPRELVMLWTDDVKRGIHEATTSIPTIEDWRAERRWLRDVAIYRRNAVGITAPREPERIKSVFAEPRLFAMLGARPLLGRPFTDNENARGAPVAVISYALWQRQFGGGDVLGKVMTVDGDLTAWKQDPRVVQVVGVMPRDFYFPDQTVELWEPMRTYFRYDEEARERLEYSDYRAVGRLAPGVTAPQVESALRVIGARLEQLFPSPARNFPGYAPHVVAALDEVAGRDLQRALWVLLGTVSVVLLIACVNVANLLLARGATREREMGIRLAIGAGRARILRQLLIESGLLSVLACGIGLLLAYGSIRALVVLAPSELPRIDQIAIDGTVLWFTVAASLAAALVFGLAPAWRSARTSPHESIKSESGSATGMRRVTRLRSALVIAECAMAVVLLSGAGLLLRSFAHVHDIDPGFTTERVLVVRNNPTPSLGLNTHSTEERFNVQEGVLHATLERIRGIPGVTAAGISGELMMSGEPDESITLDGEPYDVNAHRALRLSSIGVTEGFFEAMGVTLKRGRLLTRNDALMKVKLLFTSMTPSYQGTAEAVVVNEAFVRQFLAGRQPLGARFWEGHPGKPYWYQVVGVVGDMHRQGLEREAVPEYFGSASGGGGDFVVRTSGNPLALASQVRAAIRAIDPGATIARVSTADQQLGAFGAARRFQTLLLALFAAVALVLAAIGIYGVMRYSVEQRTREIGVRVALGASSRAIARLVLVNALRLTAIGLATGIVLSRALTGFIAHWLFGVSASDPVTMAAVTGILVVVSLVACVLPARRAARVDPLVALRS